MSTQNPRHSRRELSSRSVNQSPQIKRRSSQGGTSLDPTHHQNPNSFRTPTSNLSTPRSTLDHPKTPSRFDPKSGLKFEFYENGAQVYSGPYKFIKKSGIALLFHPNGSKMYEGDFKHGLYHGEGIYFNDKNTKIYEGEWQNDKFHGFGIEYDV
jgi:hypothetical protein